MTLKSVKSRDICFLNSYCIIDPKKYKKVQQELKRKIHDKEN